MGINYINLDQTTRDFMLKESQLGGHYISPRLTEEAKAAWQSLIEEAINSHNDDWLANEILNQGYMLGTEQYTSKGVTKMRKINQSHSAQMLAEGEFNRYYLRGLCLRAKDEGNTSLIVYRGKAVSKPRPESELKIGDQVSVDALLTSLRTNDFVTIEHAIGVPGGPNSGITCKLP